MKGLHLQMEDKVLISVIVPAYNAEKVVGDCLNSILEQTLQNIEIIVVDDGSKDSTRKILREFCEKDSRVRVIEKDQNEGLSAARNSALKIAQGKYIGFVDADDWVEKDYFESMYSAGNGADLIVTGYQHDTMSEDRKELHISRTVCMTGGYFDNKREVVSKAADIDTVKMFAYTWNKLYERSLIEENGLKFSKQVLIEDFIFNTLYWDKISSICIVPKSGYHYIKASKEALTQKFLPDFLEIMNKRFDYMKTLMVGNSVYSDSVKEQLANIYIKHALAGVVRNCAPEGRYSFFEQHHRTKILLKNERSIEASHNAKGHSKQEKICNLLFKTRLTFLVLCFGKILYAMQTKSKTIFDRLK